MIRRDYILRMVEEFRHVLEKLVALKQDARWQELTGTLDEQCRKLVGAGAAEAVSLSDTELSARLIQGESTQFVRDKTVLLIRLFQEAGDAAAGQGQVGESRAYYLRGLHLLIGILDDDQPLYHPELLPKVEVLTAALADHPLPLPTLGMLMRHYESTGQFGKAEDALFALLEGASDGPEVLQFGMSFYDRLGRLSDDALAAGNLPRGELEAGRAELERRLGARGRLSGGHQESLT